MDDRHFDKKSALEWIAVIEGEGASIREQDIYPHLKKWIWDNDVTDVIDLGCGQGACFPHVLQVTKYRGIEPSPYLLERARTLYPEADFIEGSAYKIPVESESVNGVFSIAVWHLLSDIEKASQEVARVLKEKGHFLIVTANLEQEIWKKSADHLNLHLRNENEICDPLMRHGLKVTSMGAYRSFWFFEGRKI